MHLCRTEEWITSFALSALTVCLFFKFQSNLLISPPPPSITGCGVHCLKFAIFAALSVCFSINLIRSN